MFMQPQCGAMLVTGDGEPGSTCLALFWTGGSQYCYKKKKKKKLNFNLSPALELHFMISLL